MLLIPFKMNSINENIIISSLLGFLNSVEVDFSLDTLKDVACASYSHENTKDAKTTLAVL